MKQFLTFAAVMAGAICITLPGSLAASPIISEFMASNDEALLDGDGDSSDWIEIHHPTTATSAVNLNDWYLSDNPSSPTKWLFPDIGTVDLTLQPGDYLLVMASGKGDPDNVVDVIDSLSYIHTNFKLDADGESLLLVQADGTTVADQFVEYPEQKTDISYGVGPDDTVGYMSAPTPGVSNSATFLGFVEDTKFSTDRGFYTTPTQVAIRTATEGATIRFTVNGSDPTPTYGIDYTTTLTIRRTTTLRAAAFKDGYQSSNIDTQTYLFIADVIQQSPAGAKPAPAWPNPVIIPPGPGDTQAIDYGMDPDVTTDARYADLMDDALLSIPSFSLVTDLDNLFDDTTGIYVNARRDGRDWERPVSVELLDPDGSEGFQIDAGIRIRGGMSRQGACPKHSFRLFFRSEYGDSKLEFPLFGEEGPDEFDKLDLRTGQNFSWHLSAGGNTGNSTWLYDIFTRDAHRDIGQPYTRGNFCHLYINGQYWGLYQTEERPDADYGETHLGGDADDYDAVKSGDLQGAIEANDGTLDAYNLLWSEVNSGMTGNADFFRIQGMNSDGTGNAAYTRLLDAENLIDYMLLIFYTGNRDSPLGPPGGDNQPRNLFAVYNRNTPDGFQFIAHDGEHCLGFHLPQGVNFDRVNVYLSPTLGQQQYNNPWWLHVQLMADNAEYRMRFADHVRDYFFDGGALTAEASTARFLARKNEMDLAIIAESARWGDFLTPAAPRTKDDDWLPAVNAIVNDYLQASPMTRTDVVLGQLQAKGWYPSVAAPSFNQYGGEAAYGFDLTISADAGTIHYTLDGTDPREIGGALASGASVYTPGAPVTLTASCVVAARVLLGGEWSALTDAEFIVTQPEAEFSSTQEVAVASTGWSGIYAWNFGTSTHAWSGAQEMGYTVGLNIEPGAWTGLFLYDYDSVAWTQAFYAYRQDW